MLISFSVIGFLVSASVSAIDPMKAYQSITDPKQRLMWRSQIAPPDGSDMVYYWDGSVYVSIPGDVYAPPYPGAPGNFYSHGGGNGGTPIFGFEGYNIRRVNNYVDPATGEEHPTDFYMSTREVVFYYDPQTGKRLSAWKNPLTGQKNRVMPVLNEDLNTRFRVLDGVLYNVITVNFRSASGTCDSIELTSKVGDPQSLADLYLWRADIYPRYRLDDCGRWDISDTMNLANGVYTSTEIFDFWMKQSELGVMSLKESSDSLTDNGGTGTDSGWTPKVGLSWVRIGPYLPWMCMHEDSWDGRLVYHVNSELLRDWQDIPDSFKADMEDYGFPLGGLDYVGWQSAPETVVDAPNDTTWSIFHEKVLVPDGLLWAQYCRVFNNGP